MLNKIIEFSVKNKLIIGLFTIALIAFGIYESTKLPIDAQPDITNNQVQVITVAPSFGAADIERLVTFPIEQANSNINGIEEIRSFSRFGLSLVTIVFDDKTDVYWARQQVSERLQQIKSEIPESIGIPELGPITTGLGEIYQYVVRPEKGYETRYDATELRTIQDWIVRRQLLGVKGVAEVSSFGGKLKQYEIAIKPQKLQALGLSIEDVFNALQNNNQNTGGAYIEKGPTVLFIRSEGLIGNENDIEQIAIRRNSDSTPVFIRDVAEVKIGFATRYGAMTYNDEGEVAGAVVMMLKGANSNEVIKNVKERIAVIQKTLPKGVIIEPFLDRTKMVNNAIHTVETNLVEGALIVVFILVLFLGNLRAGFLVASVIPLSLLFAIIMMNLFGVTGNLMSLGALDFGLIVDGAVIIVEAVMHQLGSSKRFSGLSYLSRSQMDKEVSSAATRMVNSAVFGQIIILIVYLPILSLKGIEGKMFIPMAQTVAFALMGAFILSLTYIPMMSSLLLSRKLQHQPNFSDRIMEKLAMFHKRKLVKALSNVKVILIGVVLLFGTSVVLLMNLGGEFIPALEEGDFAVDTKVLTGSNINTTIEYTQQAAKILKSEYPEVEKIVTKIGSGEVPTDPMPMEASDMMIILKDKKEWVSAKSFDELAEKMTQSLQAVPGITVGFQFPVQMRFNELMTGARQDVVCKIFGEDLDSLALYASRFGKLINRVEGTQNLYIEPVTGMPQIVISYNRAAIARYNLNIADIDKVVNTAFAGKSSGYVYEGEKKFDLVVRLDEAERKKMENIDNLLIPTPGGLQVPLNEVARVEIKNGPYQIQREDAKRRITVGFNVRGRDVQSVVQELQELERGKLKLGTGYYVTYGGAFENLNQAKQRLMVAVPVALILIFILLYFAFKSIRESLLIYTAIPLSAIGGIFLLALRGMPFSISAGVGFIALFGVAVLNGIVLVAEFNRLKKSGIKNIYRIVVSGTQTRLRPVLMTAFVASLGFLPMALSNGAGAEVQRPLATVVIGGLLLATLLTLFVLPILFVIFESYGKKKMRIPKTLMLLMFFLFAATASRAQSIGLDAAIDSALKNNRAQKDKDLLVKYNQYKKATAYNISKTDVNAEIGQMNSSEIDNKIGVSQSFSFPTVYAKQQKYYQELYHTAVLASGLNAAELKKNVSLLFYHILVQQKKINLLMKTDSLLAQFEKKSEERFAKGASNIIEKSSANLQREQVLYQLNEARNSLELARLQFQLILNSRINYMPDAAEVKAKSGKAEIAAKMHPLVRLAEQYQKNATSALALERSKYLPDIQVGYFNQSMKNEGINNNSRFNSVSFGLGLPLFFGAQRSNIKAAQTEIRMAENNLQDQKAKYMLALEAARIEHQKNEQQLAGFENARLPHANAIIQAALKQLNSGEINYLEWVTILQQAFLVQQEYWDVLDATNNSIITLNYLQEN
ncbi:CusA/CzcA family heavy metal efflux RND transporter [Pseudopedobacter beijingensis]|uniref:CusA/CzcA family heavy metal efflux RND transporter n=1 Tax=Pseudopedobacter beijingensis TaxID=1207056 RepID=A0ABW4IGK2_9SPHI